MGTRLLSALVIASILGACNTIAGAGRDIQSGGEAITDGARKVQRAITH